MPPVPELPHGAAGLSEAIPNFPGGYASAFAAFALMIISTSFLFVVSCSLRSFASSILSQCEQTHQRVHAYGMSIARFAETRTTSASRGMYDTVFARVMGCLVMVTHVLLILHQLFCVLCRRGTFQSTERTPTAKDDPVDLKRL